MNGNDSCSWAIIGLLTVMQLSWEPSLGLCTEWMQIFTRPRRQSMTAVGPASSTMQDLPLVKTNYRITKQGFRDHEYYKVLCSFLNLPTIIYVPWYFPIEVIRQIFPQLCSYNSSKHICLIFFSPPLSPMCIQIQSLCVIRTIILFSVHLPLHIILLLIFSSTLFC